MKGCRVRAGIFEAEYWLWVAGLLLLLGAGVLYVLVKFAYRGIAALISRSARSKRKSARSKPRRRKR